MFLGITISTRSNSTHAATLDHLSGNFVDKQMREAIRTASIRTNVDKRPSRAAGTARAKPKARSDNRPHKHHSASTAPSDLYAFRSNSMRGCKIFANFAAIHHAWGALPIHTTANFSSLQRVANKAWAAESASPYGPTYKVLSRERAKANVAERTRA